MLLSELQSARGKLEIQHGQNAVLARAFDRLFPAADLRGQLFECLSTGFLTRPNYGPQQAAVSWSSEIIPVFPQPFKRRNVTVQLFRNRAI